MTARNSEEEWAGEIEEIVVTEETVPAGNEPAEVSVVERTETSLQKLLDSVGRDENQEEDHGFYCDECLPLFQEQSDPHNITGPSFILDFPASVGVPQRALLTLPHGLTIGRSSIPNAGVGVINSGPVVSPGMHYGPFEGEVTTRDNASKFSWEIYKDKDQYEYIDAARESHSNWTRYINCARNKEESNLLAVQYKGSILFHCCRTVNAGDELMVWPSSKLLARSSPDWSQRWLVKPSAAAAAADVSASDTVEIFVCSNCQLSFTTEAFLHQHTENCPAVEPKATEAAEAENDTSDDLVVEASAEAFTCLECGKVFKELRHLRRHRLCVHANKRPYCCPHCGRSFSQASGLIRHQQVHSKGAMVKILEKPNPTHIPTEEAESVPANPDSPVSSDAAMCEEPEDMSVKEHVDNSVTASTGGETGTLQLCCSDCGKCFLNEASLKRHNGTVHKKLRPYVCTVCQKGFGQYNDLTRHLRIHKKQNKQARPDDDDDDAPEEALTLPFSCAECLETFATIDALQCHVSEHHSNDGALEAPQEVAAPDGEAATQGASSQRPRRPDAHSKVSAITKLVAPKRRASSCAERSPSDSDGPAVSCGPSLKSKWFRCNHCKKTYGDASELRAHRCSFKQHKCRQCMATFSKSGFLRRHEQTVHTKVRSYSCERCKSAFTSLSHLEEHQSSDACMKYHCTSELFSCAFCQFSFTMKGYLLKHIKRHHPIEYLSLDESDALKEQLEPKEEDDKEYMCPQCGKQYANSKVYKSHPCFRKVKVLYLCNDCGKGFTNHYSLKQHQRVHTGEKPYTCSQCSKSFSHVGQLNVHLRTHTGERPYLCTHCGDSFRQSGDLKRHERKHTGVRPYTCLDCNKSFSRPQSLKAHQMLHLGQRMFKCTQCGKSFSRNYHLRRHHQKMHS